MEHTPGPWEYEKPDENGNAVVGVELENEADGFSIAVVCSGSPDQTLADAALIAAAPELLDALRSIVNTCNVRIDDPRIKYFDEARAAIAKAEGRQP
jgi:hypothetical protein